MNAGAESGDYSATRQQSCDYVRQENGKSPSGLLDCIIPAIKSQNPHDIALSEAGRQRIPICAILDLCHRAGLQREVTVGAAEPRIRGRSVIHSGEFAEPGWTSAGQRVYWFNEAWGANPPFLTPWETGWHTVLH